MILKVNQKKSELFIQYHFNSDNSCENPYVRCDSFNSLFGSTTTYQLTLPVQHITVLFMFDYKQKYSWISEIPFGYKITTKGFFFFHIFILKYEYRHHITLKSIHINIDLLSYYGSLIQERQDTKIYIKKIMMMM